MKSKKFSDGEVQSGDQEYQDPGGTYLLLQLRVNPALPLQIEQGAAAALFLDSSM